MSGPPRPLAGRQIVVTRPRAQAASLVEALEARGAEVIAFPTIRIESAEDPGPLRAAARGADRFDWIVFASVNAVERFWAALRVEGRDARTLGGVSLCAIGSATAAALEAKGARADLVPERYVAEAAVEALAQVADLPRARILLPRAEIARTVLPAALRARGADVVEVTAYRTLAEGAGAGELEGRLRAGDVDLVTFTSSSTVRNFVEMLGADLGRAEVAAIGPITAATARELGMEVHVEAEEYTVAGLVAAIEAHFRGGVGG